MATLSVGGSLVTTNDTLSNGVQDNITRLGNMNQTSKGWCRFDGTDNTIKDSFNVTSLTDHNLGDQSVNWDTDFANANYCAVVSARVWSSGKPNRSIEETNVGSCRVYSQRGTDGTMIDTPIVCVIAFGDQ